MAVNRDIGEMISSSEEKYYIQSDENNN